MNHISLEGPRVYPLQRGQGHANIDTFTIFGVADFGPLPTSFVMQSLLSGGRGKRSDRARKLCIA
ncbi:hypothetical protein RN629_09570 [Sphingomonadaceae bacterium jetA1]|uniref:hypothetical protein n=1 Tax=Facivitalis istanbulensis TaxID=3075838 RepID=UPI0034976BCA